MSTSPASLADTLSDRYTIERELGRGGMATVYLAHDLRHKRRVALKVLDPELGAVVGAGRFRREIEMAAELQHPHVLPVFDSGEAGASCLWYTMPYVEGESLRERLQARIEDARRNTPLAQQYYEEFLSRYELPSRNQRHLVKEAREALARLSGQRDTPAERAP